MPRCDHCTELEQVGSGPRPPPAAATTLPVPASTLAMLPKRAKFSILSNMNMEELITLLEIFCNPTTNVRSTEKAEVLDIIRIIAETQLGTTTFVDIAVDRRSYHASYFALKRGWIRDPELECKVLVSYGSMAEIIAHMKPRRDEDLAPYMVIDAAYEHGARAGRMDLFQFLHDNYGNDFNAAAKCNIAFRAAAERGNLELMQWILSNYGDDIDPAMHNYDVYARAAVGGHLRILQWLSATFGEKIYSNDWFIRVFAKIAERGHLDVLMWAHDYHTGASFRRILPSDVKNALRDAAFNGHLDTIEWLHATFPPESREMAHERAHELFANGARHGHMDIVTRAHTTWNPDAFDPVTGDAIDGPYESWTLAYNIAFTDSLAFCENTRMAQWCWQNFGDHDPERSLITVSECLAGISRRHYESGQYIESMKWVLGEFAHDVHEPIAAQRKKLLDHTMAVAIRIGYMPFLQWLDETYGREALRNIEIPVYGALDAAAKQSNLRALEWYFMLHGTNETDEAAMRLLTVAVENGSLPVAQWIYTKFKPQISTNRWQNPIMKVVSSGHVHVFDWLEKTYNITHSHPAFWNLAQRAASIGDIQTLEWWHAKTHSDIIAVNGMYISAIERGQIRVLHWLKGRYGHFPTNAVITPDICFRMMSSLNLDVIKFVFARHNFKNEISARTERNVVIHAITRGRVDVLRWIVTTLSSDPPAWVQMEHIAEKLVTSNDPVVLRWFLSSFSSRFDENRLHESVTRASSLASKLLAFCTLRWLHKTFPGIIDLTSTDENSIGTETRYGAVFDNRRDIIEWINDVAGQRRQ